MEASVCALVLMGCAANAPIPAPLGYLPVGRVSGCGTAASEGFKNIVLGQELSGRLLELLPVDQVDSPCWYERPDGLVELESGSNCDPAFLAYFRSVDGNWKLETFNRQPLVLCDERVR
jgi:hypothetical protein